MRQCWMMLALGVSLAVFPAGASAQTFPVDDPVIERMWQEGMEQGSQAYRRASLSHRSPFPVPRSPFPLPPSPCRNHRGPP